MQLILIFVNSDVLMCFLQDLSEPEIFLDECERPETNLIIEENSNDENDVDDETMSGKAFIRI